MILILGYNFLKKNKPSNLDQFEEFLLNKIEFFYNHGYYDRVNKLIAIFNNYYGNHNNHYNYKKLYIIQFIIQNLILKKNLTYSHIINLFDRLFNNLDIENILFFYIELLWYLGERNIFNNHNSQISHTDVLKCFYQCLWLLQNNNINNKINITFNDCVNLYGKINNIQLNLEKKFLKLKILKNFLYAYRPFYNNQNTHLNPIIITDLLEMSLLIISEGLEFLYENPDDESVIDILGFALNLYCDYTQELCRQTNKKIDDNEKEKMINFIQYGIKLRGYIHNIWPDDLWTVRGYAWSLHRFGRFLRDIENNHSRASDKLKEANKIRKKFIENYNQQEKYKDLMNEIQNCKDEIDQLQKK